MWNPGFDWALRLPARAWGYHRAFCIYSWHYRGTPETPGLVLGLDRGGSCHGIAYRVRDRDWSDVITYLDAREMVTAVYRPITLTIAIEGGERVRARTYVADRQHEQYAGPLPADEQARIITKGRGLGGTNIDYLRATLAHLEEMGIRDRRLEEVGRIVAGQPSTPDHPFDAQPHLE
ncbi:MAG: gamma-glutamylcyclotransferase [Alphaproteobacteria bacterium]|nr:MAG: gamma-glutamylcyclotransferase [Alphaproteobacteria bacterium]